MKARTPGDVVAAYIDAIEARDFDGARCYLSDSRFSYRSPVSSADDADTFIAIISRIGPILNGIERRSIIVDGDNVCTILNFKTTMENLRMVPVAGWATVADGKITSLEVFFDASEYNKMLAD